MSEERKDAPQAEGGKRPAPTPFQILCGSLAAQVHMALGLIPDPVSQKATVELDVARQGIGLIEMLEEKTKGNLDEAETKTLGLLLAQLRLTYVERIKELSQEKGEPPAPEASP